MSLKAVRHAKQRLAPDPRNLHWANDTNKFGLKMMEKMGWSHGKGLGAKEDGVQEHVKVRLKENNLGVGATKKTSDNWLGNTDAFSKLLADLNERVEKDAAQNDSKSDSSSDNQSDVETDEKKSSKKSKKEEKEKKSKKEKKEKKDKREKKSSKSKSKRSSDEDSEEKNNIMAAISGRKASRHKYLRNKHAALQNVERLNEILGIKSETASPSISGMSTPNVEELITSTDIFAARMQQNSLNSSGANDMEEPARPVFGGLGFATSAGVGSSGFNRSGIRGLGFVKATVSVMPVTIETRVEEHVIVQSTTEETSTALQSHNNEDRKSKKESKEKKEKKETREKKERKKKETKDKKEKKEKKDKVKEEKTGSSSKKNAKRKAGDSEQSSSKKSKK
ncbi:PIN2/TERF1-interacting telomerase inhibitor 1 [Gamsiella multidivaricata]|nr:PIN2/TERF1-interacting telomerase inhibitor 1 [Gamsiella multidivaricata]